VTLPNDISFYPVGLAGCTSVTDRQTYRETTLQENLLQQTESLL